MCFADSPDSLKKKKIFAFFLFFPFFCFVFFLINDSDSSPIRIPVSFLCSLRISVSNLSPEAVSIYLLNLTVSFVLFNLFYLLFFFYYVVWYPCKVIVKFPVVLMTIPICISRLYYNNHNTVCNESMLFLLLLPLRKV